jgi:hypothetical protein
VKMMGWWGMRERSKWGRRSAAVLNSLVRVMSHNWARRWRMRAGDTPLSR